MKLDFRLPENRREAYIRYYVWQLRTWDCDTPLAVMNYLFDRLEYNIEQRFWLCFLYGNTYQIATAYAIWNEMPDKINVNMERLIKWNSDNFQNMKYQTDTKWNKGYLDKMTECYLKEIPGSQEEYFKRICSSSDPKENYERLRKIIIDKFYKFGRYVCWLYMQSLKICCDLNIEPTSMQYGLDTQSSTDGLCYVINKEAWLSRYYLEDGTKKQKRHIKYSERAIRKLDEETDSIIAEVKERFPDVKPDYFNMETALCSFKKLFRRRNGRYLSYYIHRLYEDVLAVENNFPGVEYDIIRDFIKEKLGFEPQKIDKSKMNVFLDTGDLCGLGIYEDLKNE